MNNNPCARCGCWDSDREGCTMPSCDRLYACPLEEDKEWEIIQEAAREDEDIII